MQSRSRVCSPVFPFYLEARDAAALAASAPQSCAASVRERLALCTSDTSAVPVPRICAFHYRWTWRSRGFLRLVRLAQKVKLISFSPPIQFIFPRARPIQVFFLLTFGDFIKRMPPFPDTQTDNPRKRR